MRNKIFLVCILIPAIGTTISAYAANSGTVPDPKSIVGEKYRLRYALSSATQKRVDDNGNGDRNIYGVRNFRTVLNGVYYRGGANNENNKHKRRKNRNPLPEEGLVNLCKEGFGHVVYLYPDNFQRSPHTVRCRTFENLENRLDYTQARPLHFNQSELKELHKLIFEHIRNPRLGPIYLHCWNGWHASGYVAATTLRQFCGFTGKQAEQYWIQNVDGHNRRELEGVRQKIKSFVPASEFTLLAEERAVLCPDPTSLRFQPK